MYRTFALLPVLLCSWARADDVWYVVQIKDQKAGYVHYTTAADGDGTLSTALTVIGGKMLGFGLEIKAQSKTWSDKAGAVRRMEFETTSGGKTQFVTALVEGHDIKAKSTMDGRSTERTVPIPEGARLADDTFTSYVLGGPLAAVYVFDPNSLALIKCEPKVKGKERVKTPAGEVEATVVDAGDPRASTLMYLSGKGDLIKSVGPFGMEIWPSDKETALAMGAEVDIADASAIRPDREIEDFLSLDRLTLEVSGVDLARIPSDGHQSVTKDGDVWTVKIHPVRGGLVSGSPEKVGTEWTSADLRVPADKEKFRHLAKVTAGDAVGPVARAERIRLYVQSTVRANAGMGVWRDADDVLATKDGVCRDHAILLGTLLRADGIPTRFVSGIVYAMGAFYYHAWVEFWDGHQWVGADSTRPSQTLDATHVKLTCGNVSDAFTSFLIDGAKIKVKKD